MNIGSKLKNLRVQKNLTQEELGERTDLTKGYISQIERNLSSPSLETFFSILEVLGCEPSDFFKTTNDEQTVVYEKCKRKTFSDDEKGYAFDWLVPDSNENEMEPILLSLAEKGDFKQFDPSMSETFGLVIEGEICVELGLKRYFAKQGDSIYYHATEQHQIKNSFHGKSEVLLVVTDSYL